MKAFALSDALSRLKLSGVQLSQDSSGIAAIEFAMIAPLMLVMFFGMVDVSSGVAVDRKVTIVAQSVSDLTSRYITVSDTDVTNFQSISKAILTPYLATPLKVTISQLWIDPSTGKARVQWSKGSVPLADKTIVAVPADLIVKDASGNAVANQYLIYSQVSYFYTPTVGYVLAKAGITLSDVAYTRPRQSACVFYSPALACTTI